MSAEPLNSEPPGMRVVRDLPPRHISWFTKITFLFSDLASQTGWALMAIGSIIFWNTVVSSELKFWIQDKTINWSEKAGVILFADSTGQLENRVPIWRYEHSFALAGNRYRGESYSVGKKFDEGQIAFIRYNPENPSTNVIIGLRRGMFSWRVFMLMFIPIIGLLLAFASFSHNLKVLRLIKIGEFTRGKLVSKEATKRSVKKNGLDQTIYRYGFEFEHDETKYLASCKTHRIDMVEDEESEIILYDKYNPSYNLVYDAVLNIPVIDQQGHIRQMEFSKSLFLFLPVFTLMVNLLFGLF